MIAPTASPEWWGEWVTPQQFPHGNRITWHTYPSLTLTQQLWQSASTAAQPWGESTGPLCPREQSLWLSTAFSPQSHPGLWSLLSVGFLPTLILLHLSLSAPICTDSLGKKIVFLICQFITYSMIVNNFLCLCLNVFCLSEKQKRRDKLPSVDSLSCSRRLGLSWGS